MIELGYKMYKSALLLTKGTTDTGILAKRWGCNFWTAQSRLKRLKALNIIETRVVRNQLTGKFAGIEILQINQFRLREKRNDE